MIATTLVVLAFFSSGCLSFLPNKIAGIWTPGNTRTHVKQSEDEINNFIMAHWGITDDSQFTSTMKKARKTITKANAAVDDDPATKNDGKCHFDDELFADGQARLMTLRGNMIGFLQQANPDADSARQRLGQQLHTLQDFYSHSNWVESGKTKPSNVIGWPDMDAYPASGLNITTCNQYCETPQTTSYLNDLTCLDSCKAPESSSSLLNGILLALQTDCVYSEEGDGFCILPDCSNNLTPGFDSVTTGYYKVDGVAASNKLAGKCSHGGMNDHGASGTEGINKDSEWDLYAPHGLIAIPGWGPGANGHQAAATLSQAATQDYLEQFLVDYADVNPALHALTEPQLRNLYGIGAAPLVFVVDCTGSMGDIISGIQSSLTQIVNDLAGTQDQPQSYTLVCYNDPADLNEMWTTTNSTTFLSDLGNLYASGGGDCPEPALAALNQTIPTLDPYSNVFLFTNTG
jgi:hypothetical protein